MNNESVSQGNLVTSSNSSLNEHENIQVIRVIQRFNSNSQIPPPDFEELKESEDGTINERSNPSADEEEIPEEISDNIDDSYSSHESINVFNLYQRESGMTSTEANSILPQNTIDAEDVPCRMRFTRFKENKERSQSAPARPLTETEELKNSVEFYHLEVAAISANKFLYNKNGKFDFESLDGYYLCEKFLLNIETLSKLMNIKPVNREYRKQFAQPYRMLYKRYEDFCYLIEILDLAQERFPYIIINDEKYIFSPNVLRYGEQLINSFITLKDCILELYEMTCEDSENTMKKIKELKSCLRAFDKSWTCFEKIYVLELILIDKDARRYVLQGIELDNKLRTYEISETLKGNIYVHSPTYNLLRKKFITLCGKINSIANYIGKGKDDLSVDILIAAEGISKTITDNKSRAVRKLANRIRETFMKLRKVFRNYAGSVELVDPELRNNQELVDVLVEFEKTWDKGKSYLVDPALSKMVISFSEHVEGLIEKYQEVKNKIESMDAEIFLIIPSLAILRSLDENNSIIYSLYYPEVENNEKEAKEFKELKEIYKDLRKNKNSYEVYNAIEQIILDNEIQSKVQDDVKKLLNGIKKLAILLQRNKPLDWNSLMETAMGII